jgi:hypothetical protein
MAAPERRDDRLLLTTERLAEHAHIAVARRRPAACTATSSALTLN